MEKLNSAGVIVILYSPSFAMTDYCQKELQIALSRKASGQAKVFIVRIRPCELQQEVALYQIRPTKGRSISTERDHDAALSEIAAEIRRELQPGPRGAYYGSEMEPVPARNRGRLVAKLCDRQTQENAFGYAFELALTEYGPSPQIYFIPGQEGQCHASLVERFIRRVEEISGRARQAGNLEGPGQDDSLAL